MKLKNVYIDAFLLLQAAGNEADSHDGSFLREQSRTFCNYVYRNFYLAGRESIRPSRIIVRMSDSPRESCYADDSAIYSEVRNRLNELRAIPHSVELDPHRIKFGIRSLVPCYREPDLHEFFASVLDEGLVKLERDFGHPRQEIMAVARAFIDGGCVNRWTRKTCRAGSTGLTGRLEYEFTTRSFTADFVLTRKGEEIFRDRFLTAIPDEQFYFGQYRELKYSAGTFSTAHLSWDVGRFLA
jgi:hypothetical protein